MNETAKTKKLWDSREWAILTGKGIDIGCGPDPVLPNVRRFDVEDGDANEITRYVNETFDFVYSSHCLEHMRDPRQALREWWKLVKPGGHLFFLVPDEDLYEQGIFPSRFNSDHKATFTISKSQSWSPVSVNVLDLANSLPDAELVNIELQDSNYERRVITHGLPHQRFLIRGMARVYRDFKRKTGIGLQVLDALHRHYIVVDQTMGDTLAQIQCIVKKRTAA